MAAAPLRKSNQLTGWRAPGVEISREEYVALAGVLATRYRLAGSLVIADVAGKVELADGDVRWRAVIPGGQVDHKGDPHYED